MDGLYKKVVKGNFQKLPSHYSVDLNNIVKLFLKVNPQLRPTCDKILTTPPIQRRVDENKLMLENEEDLVPELLATIKIPTNLYYLTDKLPGSNYNPIKTRQSCKVEFVGKKDERMGRRGINNSEEKNELNISQRDESIDSCIYIYIYIIKN